MKRGYETTEFWLTLATLISTITGVVFNVLPTLPASIIVGLIVMGYCIGRGLAKSKIDIGPGI